VVTYAPFLFLSKTAIPVDSILATRCTIEPAQVMAPGGAATSKLVSESRSAPIQIENNEVSSEEAKKGPLSSLGTKKIFTSDSPPKEAENLGFPDPFEQVASLRGHRGWVKTVLFSSDRTLVVSGGSDGSVKLWRFAHDGAPEQTVPHPHSGGVQALALSKDNSKLASAAAQPEGIVRLWDLSSSKPKLRALLQVPKAPVETLVFSPSGDVLAISCDKSILLWNVAKPALREDAVLAHEQAVKSIAFAPDGLKLVCGSADGTVRLWDSNPHVAKELAVLEGAKDGVLSIAWSSDGQLGTWQGPGHVIHVWEVMGDVPSPRIMLQGHEGSARYLMFPLEANRLLTVDNKNWIFLWDLTTGTKIQRWQLPGGSTIASVGGTTDGRYVVAGTMGIVNVYRLFPKNKCCSKNETK
jgi:WD40 repeat protein